MTAIINVTDGRTGRHTMAIPRYAHVHRAVKMYQAAISFLSLPNADFCDA